MKQSSLVFLCHHLGDDFGIAFLDIASRHTVSVVIVSSTSVCYLPVIAWLGQGGDVIYSGIPKKFRLLWI
jgi:hypothetical protein